MELSDDDTLKFIKEKLTKDYNEISDELKYLINVLCVKQYKNVPTVVIVIKQ